MQLTVSSGTMTWTVTFWPAWIVEPGAGAPKNWAWAAAKSEVRTTRNFMLFLVKINDRLSTPYILSSSKNGGQLTSADLLIGSLVV